MKEWRWARSIKIRRNKKDEAAENGRQGGRGAGWIGYKTGEEAEKKKESIRRKWS